VWKIKQLQGMLGVNEINVSCPTWS
jgi:hypothetical protein